MIYIVWLSLHVILFIFNAQNLKNETADLSSCETWCSHSSEYEEYNLLGHKPCSLGDRYQHFCPEDGVSIFL